MTTRHVTVRKITRKHLRLGEWLICVDRERETYDAIFIRYWDGLLVVYPTPYVKAEIGEKLLPQVSLDAMNEELVYVVWKENKPIVGKITAPYATNVSIKYARMLRKQMRRISSTEECHELVDRLMCLGFGECHGTEGMRLCDVTWFNEDEMYRRIYDVLNTESMLPNPCDITILQQEPPGVPEDVRGMGFRSTRKIWFRQTPPEYIVFAHELIHLIPKKRIKYLDAYNTDELYAYALSTFVVELAKRGIKPPVNPVRLFEIDNTNIILETIGEVYNVEFEDLAEFFKWLGVIPEFLTPREDSLGYRVDPTYPEEIIAINTIAILIEGIEYDEWEFQVLLRLLDKLSQKQPRQGGAE
jgi:tRNA isopentenyl-2-thiomethyl-A-37 hydroxylase MiaE